MSFQPGRSRYSCDDAQACNHRGRHRL
jgi:hypothetical protein